MKTSRFLIAVAAFCSMSIAGAKDYKLMLSGTEETPPVKTMATGQGTISVSEDGAISGSVATNGIDGTMGHIHVGAIGTSGPVAIKLEKDGNMFRVPAGTMLSPDQIRAWKAGELYVNIHSEAHKAGELRAQLK